MEIIDVIHALIIFLIVNNVAYKLHYLNITVLYVCQDISFKLQEIVSYALQSLVIVRDVVMDHIVLYVSTIIMHFLVIVGTARHALVCFLIVNIVLVLNVPYVVLVG